MKNILSISILTTMLFVFSCTKPKPTDDTNTTPTKANVSIVFGSKIDGVLLEKAVIKYTNAMLSDYSVTTLKYVLSNVTLTKDDNTTIKLSNIFFVDAFKPETQSILINDVPNGKYKNISYNLGVESPRNTNGPQEELSVGLTQGMIWSWASGYIFYKHEGKFKDAIGNEVSLVYHLGSDSAYNPAPISFPITMEVKGVAKRININFNANKMYNSPVIDFNNGSNRQSNFPMDSQWIKDMKANVQDAFTLGTIE